MTSITINFSREEKSENEEIIRKNLLPRNTRKQNESKASKRKPHELYSWTPPGLSPNKVDEYFAQLPNHKVPRWKSPGEQYREQQLLLQLPKQDLTSSYCLYLERNLQKSFDNFIHMKIEMALDIAYVRESLDKQKECSKCRGTMLKGDIAVIVPKLGESWHPACFVCSVCEELLVDLAHCVKDDKIYCERHFAEQVKPRCSYCDELIFSGEYTKALSKTWHSDHFCCWQCDKPLTGRCYILRDEHPYCIKCYEHIFSTNCHQCEKTIGIDSKVVSYREKNWHEACFICSDCKVSLIEKPFGSKDGKMHCATCYNCILDSRCYECNELFRAGMKKMEYKGHHWHENCFTCSMCKTVISTQSFIPHKEEIYCTTCYKQKYATRCIKCNYIITGSGVTYRNEPWHRECFTCINCGTSLASKRFTSRDGKPYCGDCFGELFAKKCASCNKPITGQGGTRFISFEDRNWHNDCFQCAECLISLVGKGFISDGPDILCPECAKQRLM